MTLVILLTLGLPVSVACSALGDVLSFDEVRWIGEIIFSGFVLSLFSFIAMIAGAIFATDIESESVLRNVVYYLWASLKATVVAFFLLGISILSNYPDRGTMFVAIFLSAQLGIVSLLRFETISMENGSSVSNGDVAIRALSAVWSDLF